jgi:hypothetical protein
MSQRIKNERVVQSFGSSLVASDYPQISHAASQVWLQKFVPEDEDGGGDGRTVQFCCRASVKAVRFWLLRRVPLILARVSLKVQFEYVKLPTSTV